MSKKTDTLPRKTIYVALAKYDAHVVILKFELEDYDVRASPLGVGGKRCNEVSRGERLSYSKENVS